MTTAPLVAHSESEFITADAYVRHARLNVTGRTLQRWCDENPFLAERLREMRTKRRRFYDGTTAKKFREHFVAAQVEHRRALAHQRVGEKSGAPAAQRMSVNDASVGK